MNRGLEQRLSIPESLAEKSVNDLLRSINAAMSDDSIRVVVIQGSPQTFCRGLDLDALLQEGAGHDSLTQAMQDYCNCLHALRFSHKPTVALVQGAALGGGIGLVAACDIALATPSATFALPEVLFGFAPAMVLPFLLERVSRQTARAWALTAATRSAQEALSAGLVDQVVAESELAGELKRWLKQLQRGQRRGVETVKQLTSTMASLDQPTALLQGQQSTLAALRDPDVVRAIALFKSEGILPWEAT